MPALKDLYSRLGQDSDWQRAFDKEWPDAQRVTPKIPLVHVTDITIPFDKLDHPYYELDVSQPRHSSTNTLAAEDHFELCRSLYFYRGRTYPDFKAGFALAFDASAESAHTGSATPFDTGGIHSGHIALTLPPGLSLKDFVQDSMIPLANCSTEFANFLAAYFSPFSAYWSDARPCRADPEGIYQNPRNTDWRAWVFEVRFCEGHNVFDVVAWTAAEPNLRDFEDRILHINPLNTPLSSAIELFYSRYKGQKDDLDYTNSMDEWMHHERIGL